MAMPLVVPSAGAVSPARASPALGSGGFKQSTESSLRNEGAQAGKRAELRSPSVNPVSQSSRATATPSAVGGVAVTRGSKVVAPDSAAKSAAQLWDRVTAAQRKMDHVLQLAESGKTFTSSELIALQANVYRASQELDLAGKVVEKVSSGVKQVLQTQV